MEDSFYQKEQLTELYDRHVDMVYRICYLFLKNRYDAEDMVQATFLKLIRHGRFDSAEHEKAWLIVTASNLCRDHLKHWWRKNVPLESLPDEKPQSADNAILEQVFLLPRKVRTTIYLYYYEGYNTVELSRMLGKKESTIRGYLHTGRKLLKIAMGGDQNE
ncbi:RNA polymerase sigma factor [Candidatus Soleaferrea massiliensis]|uniref:RNA polymerase sigma factor n=1 Tax=Candidatus Soleaferrea massiliensis TaxID=1470354 RepID=UPI00058AC58F|nr:RNA polymerase sigma factor [Candidatus Soleaferrea massiliensis]